MIRASDGASDLAIGFGQLGASVATRVEESVELATVVSGDDDGTRPDVSNQEFAGFGDFRRGANNHPRPFEDSFLFECEEVGVGIRVGVQAGGFCQSCPSTNPGRFSSPAGGCTIGTSHEVSRCVVFRGRSLLVTVDNELPILRQRIIPLRVNRRKHFARRRE